MKMERLTERKTSYPSCDKKGNLTRVDYIKIKDKALAEEKLCLLEDIEEELGIDLLTLFKALKYGVYVKYDSDFGITKKPNIKIVKDNATGICYRNKKWYLQEEETLTKDYGKTWALTKEELVNKEKEKC